VIGEELLFPKFLAARRVTLCLLQWQVDLQLRDVPFEGNDTKNHRKKPRLPGIRRTRAGLNLRCRPYGGLCRTRTGAFRPRPYEPAGTCVVVVRHLPVLGHSFRHGGSQDSVLDRHILRHCCMCRSYAETTGPRPFAAGSMPGVQMFGAAAPAQGGKGPICSSAGPRPDVV
jgi:hypothetical protein